MDSCLRRNDKEKGWHASKREKATELPLIMPYFLIAILAYSEQEGENRHILCMPKSCLRAGETNF